VVKLEEESMKAKLDGYVIAESDDIVEQGGYHYFPSADVRLDWLEKAEKTASDRACPHGVQFFDVVIAGNRNERAAWRYEAPQPSMRHVADRFGFWDEVEVG
jgi:uncharacterized protein (DUF427 family)